MGVSFANMKILIFAFQLAMVNMLVIVNMLVMVMKMVSRPTSLSGNANALDHDCFVSNDAIGLILPTVTMMQCNAMQCNAMQ